MISRPRLRVLALSLGAALLMSGCSTRANSSPPKPATVAAMKIGETRFVIVDEQAKDTVLRDVGDTLCVNPQAHTWNLAVIRPTHSRLITNTIVKRTGPTSFTLVVPPGKTKIWKTVRQRCQYDTTFLSDFKSRQPLGLVRDYRGRAHHFIWSETIWYNPADPTVGYIDPDTPSRLLPFTYCIGLDGSGRLETHSYLKYLTPVTASELKQKQAAGWYRVALLD